MRASVLEQGLILIRQKLGKINVTEKGGASLWHKLWPHYLHPIHPTKDNTLTLILNAILSLCFKTYKIQNINHASFHIQNDPGPGLQFQHCLYLTLSHLVILIYWLILSGDEELLAMNFTSQKRLRPRWSEPGEAGEWWHFSVFSPVANNLAIAL